MARSPLPTMPSRLPPLHSLAAFPRLTCAHGLAAPPHPPSLHALTQNEELELQYKTCSARILDSKRRFLEAATRYYELSQIGRRVIGGRLVSCQRGGGGGIQMTGSRALELLTPPFGPQIDEEELQQALLAAITCTILAAAGPQRSRMLATLYKGEAH
jgi:COP9 signalosome complex subunit 4